MNECRCTSEYDQKIDGQPVGAYCSKWVWNDVYYWCYLSGGMNASSCPGALKSSVGDFYFSSHADVCTGKVDLRST